MTEKPFLTRESHLPDETYVGVSAIDVYSDDFGRGYHFGHDGEFRIATSPAGHDLLVLTPSQAHELKKILGSFGL